MRTSVANVQIEDFELWFAKRKFLIFKDFSLVAEVRYRIPPSPPLMQAQVVHTTWAFCIGTNFLVERYRARLRSHRRPRRQILPPRRSSTHASAKPWQPCLKMVG